MDKITPDKFEPGSAVSETIEPVKFVPHKATGARRKLPFNLKLFVVTSVIIIVGLFILFLFSGRAVYFKIEPEIAETSVDSVFSMKLADRYLILPGHHNVSISAPGYIDAVKEFQVTDENSQEFEFTLEKMPGHLDVSSKKVSGATIMIDGVERGTTPGVVRDIKPGKHTVSIIAERYFPYEDQVTITGLDKTQKFSAELVPAWADINFTTTPAGATVYVGEESLGVTPLEAEILQGKQAIRLVLSGHKQWQKNIQVVAGEPQSYTDIVLEPADAIVNLKTIPAGASITVDGKYIGLTPVEVAVAPDKAVTASMFKQGYLPSKRSFTLASGEQQDVTIRLKPELVTVTFSIQPADASLYINGKLQKSANTKLQLAAVQQKITVKKNGYVEQTKVISPRAGMDQEVRMRLKTVADAKREAVKPVIQTAAGQSLKLFYPGSFTSGASRREPGRRANETIQNIKLTKPFYLGIKEVTNAEYGKFRSGHISGVIQGNSLNAPDMPVARVTWQDAAKYCNWLSKNDSLTPFYKIENDKVVGINRGALGYRLPTEAEWTWAARVQPDNSMLKFPWGSSMPPRAKSGNFADVSSATILGKVIANYDDGYAVTAPVGKFPMNARGLYDMGGNVSEWVNDFYDISVSQKSVQIDPMGPTSGDFHVIRGSSWAHGTITELRFSYRDYGKDAREDVGFRVARFADL